MSAGAMFVAKLFFCRTTRSQNHFKHSIKMGEDQDEPSEPYLPESHSSEDIISYYLKYVDIFIAGLAPHHRIYAFD